MELEAAGLGLHAPLRPYQWDGVSFLTHTDAALLADEMGLGKTVQAAVALRLLLRRTDVTRALVVVPGSLRLNWERELARWAPDTVVRSVRGPAVDRQALFRLPLPVLVASYEHLRADIQRIRPYVHFDVVVLDEAQRIKNRDSATALACRLIPRTRSWALTGTPLENRPSDLTSIFGFLKPGLLSSESGRTQIHAAIRSHFLRRRQRDVLGELPPLLVQDLLLELDGQQRRAYDDLWASRLAFLGRRPSEMQLFALITRLKQICNFDLESSESAKLDALKVVLEGLTEAEDKVLIFSQYVETLRWLSRRLGGFPHALYHGELSEGERDETVQEFTRSDGPRALLMSLRAGGVGLNLQAASTLVLFDRWWNPAVEDQAIHRAHRFGRDLPLHVFRFVVTDSIEQRILSILEEKAELFRTYVEQAESSVVRALSRQDLLRLLDLPQHPIKEPV